MQTVLRGILLCHTLFNKLGSVCMKCALSSLLSLTDDLFSFAFLAVLPGGPCLVDACLQAHTMMSISAISSLSFKPWGKREKNMKNGECSWLQSGF